MLYSNHKENGLIRIFAVHRALAGLDGYRGCGVVKKEKRPGAASLLRRNMLLFSPRSFFKCPGFLFEQGYIHQISVPSGNLNLTLAVAPRASPIFSHSSTVNFPVFNRLFKSCGDQPRRRASSEFDTPQYPVAISTICRAVTVNHLHASSINHIISKVK